MIKEWNKGNCPRCEEDMYGQGLEKGFNYCDYCGLTVNRKTGEYVGDY